MNFERDGDDGENIDLESDKGFKNPNKSSQKDQIDPNSPEVPGKNRFPEGETAEGDNDEGDVDDKNTQFLSQIMSQDLISPTKAGKTSKSNKEKPSEGSKLVEDVKSRKPLKKAKSMNITPQSYFPDAHDESDEAPNSSLKGNVNPVCGSR